MIKPLIWFGNLLSCAPGLQFACPKIRLPVPPAPSLSFDFCRFRGGPAQSLGGNLSRVRNAMRHHSNASLKSCRSPTSQRLSLHSIDPHSSACLCGPRCLYCTADSRDTLHSPTQNPLLGEGRGGGGHSARPPVQRFRLPSFGVPHLCGPRFGVLALAGEFAAPKNGAVSALCHFPNTATTYSPVLSFKQHHFIFLFWCQKCHFPHWLSAIGSRHPPPHPASRITP
jgi:hypothetical protein